MMVTGSQGWLTGILIRIVCLIGFDVFMDGWMTEDGCEYPYDQRCKKCNRIISLCPY